MSQKDAPRAVSILTPGTGGKFVFDEDSLREIVDRPSIAGKQVAVVSVAGAFRKGKSFLLNFFVHYLQRLTDDSKKDEPNGKDWFSAESVLDKFHFRGGSERDTRGIQMWSEPFVIRDGGKEVVVLLMDTQGTFDSGSTVKECATIFALSTMLSSLQIYNISQNIQENDLQHLQLFAEYARLAGQHGNTSPFQSLLFLVRDWPNAFEYRYGFEGGQKFLNYKLQIEPNQISVGRDVSSAIWNFLVPTAKKHAKELKHLRIQITEVFQQMKCFLMPHPGLQVAKNHKNKKLGEIEADFKEQMLEFVPSIFGDDLQVKRIAGQTVTCSQLVHFFKVYVEVFQGSTLPEPKAIYEATAEASLMTVVDNSKAVYEEGVVKVVHGPQPLADVEEFMGHHMTYQTQALQFFEKTPKMGDETMHASHQRSLQKYMESRYEELLKVVGEQQKIVQKKKEMEELERKRQEELKREREEMERLQKAREEEARRQKAEMEQRERQRQAEMQWERDRLAEESSRLAEERRENQRRAADEKAERNMMRSYGGGGMRYGYDYGIAPSYVHVQERSYPQPHAGKYDRNGRWHGPDGRFAVDPN